MHAVSEIRTRDPSNQAPQTYALDRAATGIDFVLFNRCYYITNQIREGLSGGTR
jgi:hypothetical protein